MSLSQRPNPPDDLLAAADDRRPQQLARRRPLNSEKLPTLLQAGHLTKPDNQSAARPLATALN